MLNFGSLLHSSHFVNFSRFCFTDGEHDLSRNISYVDLVPHCTFIILAMIGLVFQTEKKTKKPDIFKVKILSFKFYFGSFVELLYYSRNSTVKVARVTIRYGTCLDIVPQNGGNKY